MVLALWVIGWYACGLVSSYGLAYYLKDDMTVDTLLKISCFGFVLFVIGILVVIGEELGKTGIFDKIGRLMNKRIFNFKKDENENGED